MRFDLGTTTHMYMYDYLVWAGSQECFRKFRKENPIEKGRWPVGDLHRNHIDPQNNESEHWPSSRNLQRTCAPRGFMWSRAILPR
jgi:hypothetical protein